MSLDDYAINIQSGEDAMEKVNLKNDRHDR